jgi:hypothetical protein
MAALISPRSTQRFGVNAVEPQFSFPIKAATKCIQGGIAVLDTSVGYVCPGRTALGLIAVGIFDDPPPAGIDNTSGAAGALNAPVRRGIFKFNNSAGGDLIAVANLGTPCYIVDDNTVALTDGLGTRSFAGAIMQVDSDGVWVEMGPDLFNPPAFPRDIVTIPIDFATLANAQQYAFTPGFAGRILGISVMVRKPATTAAKAATVQAQVAGVNTTGGAVAMTSANMTPAGANVAGTAITAGNTFTAAQSIGFAISGVTAFVEGDGEVLIILI